MTAIIEGAATGTSRNMQGVTTLDDIINPTELADAISHGHIREQHHPTEPLAILNYTEACAYHNAWTHATLTCRGLIYRTDTRQVVARPFPKFFNYGQPGAPTLDLHGPAVVTDKADGSLGILYPLPSGGWAIATRGSFTSDQARHATDLWNARYADSFHPSDGVTHLFEIIYPGNRIVVDYADLNDLVLLGSVDIASGATRSATSAPPGWYGPTVESMPYTSLAEALAAPPRPNREGMVVHCPATDQRIKIKQDDYVALHRIVTGLNARVVWQHLVDGKPLDDLVAPLPDEFHPWCNDIAAQIAQAVEQRVTQIEKAYGELVGALPDGFNRKQFAEAAVPHPDKWAMFLLLDGRDIRGELLKRAKPDPYQTPLGRAVTEDNC